MNLPEGYTSRDPPYALDHVHVTMFLLSAVLRLTTSDQSFGILKLFWRIVPTGADYLTPRF